MYRQIQNYENLQKRIFDGVGEYGIPQIQPTSYQECEWIGFNYARSEKNRAGKGVHFSLDDYQFNSVWQTPDKYLDIAGLTQKQFSELFEVSIDTVKSWDCGRRKPTRLEEKLIIEKLEKIINEKKKDAE